MGGLELEDGGGRNGKWGILCAVRRGAQYAVRKGLEC